MKKIRTTKYRLILSFSDQDLAYEKIFLEMIAIEDAYSDAALVSQAKRKLFLRILFTHCNQNLQTDSRLTNTKPIPSQILEVAPTTESNTDPPSKQAPSPPATPPPQLQRVSEETIGADDLPKSSGILSFGKFLLEIK